MCYGQRFMPWSVFDRGTVRHRAQRGRLVGACVETLLAETGAALRRRRSEDVARVAELLSADRYCVPCLTILTGLDARTVYHAIQQLRVAINVALIRDQCGRCTRTTTIHTIIHDDDAR